MRLAADIDRVHRGGAELAAVSVDDDGRQAGMAERWKLTHTQMIADPGGDRFLRPLGLFDPEERDGIALPGMLIIAESSNGPTEAYRFEGRDFADRTNDAELWAALDSLGLPPVDPPPWVPTAAVPADLDRFFAPANLDLYYRGNMFAALALGRRAADDTGRRLAAEHQEMARATLDAWKQLNS